MTERKLATIRRIADIKPIEGADKIECIVVDGWEVVAQKGQGHEIGGFVVYFEIDSVLPLEPEFEFLKKGCYVKREWIEGYRLKTIRMRGQRSQGLILPISLVEPVISRRNPDLPLLSEEVAETGAIYGLEAIAELDLTDALGVQKWEPPIAAELACRAKGNFPSFIPKTDQDRIQNCFGILSNNYPVDLWEVTLKLDGSSCTIYHKDGYIGVCSRNLELEINEFTQKNAFVKQANIFGPKLKELGRNIALQGELMGPGIQGNHEGFKNTWFILYDVFDIDQQRKLTPAERYGIQSRFVDYGELFEYAEGQSELAIGVHVPVISVDCPVFEKFKSVDDLLEYADMKSLNNPVAEGLVFKNLRDPSISFKVINNKFIEMKND